MNDFLELIEKHKDEFYRYTYRTVWDSGVADDVFSSAVLAAWENKHKFTPGTNFRAWMYRIITNKCFVANRETGRTPKPLDDVHEGALLHMDADRRYREALKDPDSFLEQCGDELNRAMKQLSTAQRTCILLRSMEKFSYKEIAEILDMPVGTVMTHLSRGRAKLRGELLEYAQSRGYVRQMPRLVPKDDDLRGERAVESNGV